MIINSSYIFLLLQLLVLIVVEASACQYIAVESTILFEGVRLIFRQLTVEQSNNLYKQLNPGESIEYYDSGRPTYISEANEHTPLMYLFHTQTPDLKAGVGRWVIGDSFASKDLARAFVDSWAVTPYLTLETSDGIEREANRWHVPDQHGEWNHDPSLKIYCAQGEDHTVYFESSTRDQPGLAGFYVERISENPNLPAGTLYSLITPPLSKSDGQFYLFRLPNTNRWMIGAVYGQDMGIAFCDVPDDIAAKIQSAADMPPQFVRWKFISPMHSHQWMDDTHAVLLSGKTMFDRQSGAVHTTEAILTDGEEMNLIRFDNVYEVLRFSRAVKSLPGLQIHGSLRNKLPIPYMGLGTGGIFREESLEVFSNALNLGYRLFDLAREYQNEHIMAQAISADGAPSRKNLFLETKVWPTDLGFFPTIDAVTRSLQDLGSNYIDLNLLHWPSCYPHITWMHCETTVDPTGTWRESWRAFEKEYAEGRIMSIGVSNFDNNLLQEMEHLALVLPHVVQNHAEPGRVDEEVRNWCTKNHVVYQPYASLRNLDALPEEYKIKLDEIAARQGVSSHAVALRFFLQSGAACIPRSRSREHLQENFDVTSWQLSDADMNALGWKIDS